jgi:hypothetical protein
VSEYNLKHFKPKVNFRNIKESISYSKRTYYSHICIIKAGWCLLCRGNLCLLWWSHYTHTAVSWPIQHNKLCLLTLWMTLATVPLTLTFRSCAFFPHGAFTCFMWSSEWRAVIPNSFKELVFLFFFLDSTVRMNLNSYNPSVIPSVDRADI